MSPDFQGPPCFAPPTSGWQPLALRRLLRGLEPPALSLERRAEAWEATVAAFRDPASPERRALDPELAAACRLSQAGLDAGLEAVLEGLQGPALAPCLAAAAALPTHARRRPALTILAGNLPGLTPQALLPALLAGRPMLLKSPSAEPLFAPAFLRALTAREPRLAASFAAVTWRGGDRDLEAALLAEASPVLAYGSAATLEDLRPRVSGRLLRFGPRTSLAVVAGRVDLAATARGLAEDIALFDQRGCLSVEAIYTEGDALELAEALAAALAEIGQRLPPGPSELAARAAVRQARAEAELRGAWIAELPAGTVVVDPDTTFRPGPGLRFVRVHALPTLTELPTRLAAWQDRLQGAALAGEAAWRLAPALAALGVSRCRPPGQLQRTEATWQNGGHDLLAVLAAEP
jgi:hypothetical protein